jgi:protein-tyrosine phosphatase
MNIDCNEIIPDRLWVGGYLCPDDAVLLAKQFISTVLSLQTDEDLSTYGIQTKKLLKAYQAADIELRRIPIPDLDKSDLVAKLPLCVAELEEALKPVWARVYVHCTAGLNRSPTVVAAYLIRSRNMSAREAYEYVTARRHCKPSLEALEQYEESLKTQS